jgi:hypothetical protein
VERERDRTIASTAVSDLLQLFTIVPLGNADFQRALTLRLRGYEDAAQVAADYLVTRNEKDFKNAPVTTSAAGEVLALIDASTGRGSRSR